MRVLADAGIEVVAEAGDADELRRSSGGSGRTSRSSTCGCRRRRPTRGPARRERSASEQPDVGVLVLSQVVETKHALELFSERPEGFGYLLKDRVLEIDDFIDRSGAWARRHRDRSRGGRAADGRARARRPLDELTRASARCSG